MEKKELKKVFEFIATMLDDESQEIVEVKKSEAITETDKPSEEFDITKYNNLPDSLAKLSKKTGLDIDRIVKLMERIDKQNDSILKPEPFGDSLTYLNDILTKELSEYKNKVKLLEDEIKQTEREEPTYFTGATTAMNFEPYQNTDTVEIDAEIKIDDVKGITIEPLIPFRGVEYRNGRLYYNIYDGF